MLLAFLLKTLEYELLKVNNQSGEFLLPVERSTGVFPMGPTLPQITAMNA